MINKPSENTNLQKVKVKFLEKVSDELYILDLDYNYKFIPGQVVRLTVSELIPPRIYSIASGTDDSSIKILFKVKETGVLTPLLAELKNGDAVLISKPFGEFAGTADKAVWIATGTGIAPFISMVLSGNINEKILIHGTRFKSSFYLQSELIKLLGKQYIRCCTSESGENIYNGRVTDYLRNNVTLSLSTNYYLCGSAEMVIEVRDLLIEKGVPYNQIIAEIYF